MINITHSRINPSAWANSRDRYITVTPGWALFPLGDGRYKLHNRYRYCITFNFNCIAFLKQLRNGRFASEDAVRRFKIVNSERAVWRFKIVNGHLDPEVVSNTRWNFQKARRVWRQKHVENTWGVET